MAVQGQCCDQGLMAATAFGVNSIAGNCHVGIRFRSVQADIQIGLVAYCIPRQGFAMAVGKEVDTVAVEEICRATLQYLLGETLDDFETLFDSGYAIPLPPNTPHNSSSPQPAQSSMNLHESDLVTHYNI